MLYNKMNRLSKIKNGMSRFFRRDNLQNKTIRANRPTMYDLRTMNPSPKNDGFFYKLRQNKTRRNNSSNLKLKLKPKPDSNPNPKKKSFIRSLKKFFRFTRRKKEVVPGPGPGPVTITVAGPQKKKTASVHAPVAVAGPQKKKETVAVPAPAPAPAPGRSPEIHRTCQRSRYGYELVISMCLARSPITCTSPQRKVCRDEAPTCSSGHHICDRNHARGVFEWHHVDTDNGADGGCGVDVL